MHVLNQLPAKGQPQAGAAIEPCCAGIGLGEGRENAFQPLLGHANACVDHFDTQAATGPAGAYFHTAGVGEFDGVAQQVIDDLPGAGGIAQKAGG